MNRDEESPRSSSVLAPYRLPRRIRAAIGDIICIGAELDHLISMSLFQMANVRPRKGFVLLRKASISQKIDTLRFLVDEENSDQRVKDFDNIIEDINRFTKIRNAVSHGLYRGIMKNSGDLSFSAPQDFVPSDKYTHFYYKNLMISEWKFYKCVEEGRGLIERLMSLFDVAPFHETFQEQYHQEQPVSQRAQRRNALSKRPRKSSPSEA